MTPNPRDVPSVRMVAGSGFPALATSSAASASVLGRTDGALTRDQALAHARTIVELFAPGLPDLESVKAVCLALSKPVNFMVGIKGKSFPVADLAAAGVRRISLATSLYRAAMTGFLRALREVKETGGFSFVDSCVTTAEINQAMGI